MFQIGDNYFHFILQSTWTHWPRSNQVNEDRARLFDLLVNAYSALSSTVNDEKVTHISPAYLVEYILKFIVCIVRNEDVEQDEIARHYVRMHHDFGSLSFSDQSMKQQDYSGLMRLHRSIQQQLIRSIERSSFFSITDSQELKLLCSIVGSGLLAMKGEEKDKFITTLTRAHRNEGDISEITRIIGEELRKGAISDAWIGVALTLIDDYLSRLTPRLSPDAYLGVIRCVQDLSFQDNRRFDVSSHDVALMQIQDPCIAWIASWYSPTDLQFEALTNPGFSRWDVTVQWKFAWMCYEDLSGEGYFSPAEEWQRSRRHQFADSQARMTVIRAILLDGPSEVQQRLLDGLNKCDWANVEEEKVRIPVHV
jgi:hypothetical protein